MMRLLEKIIYFIIGLAIFPAAIFIQGFFLNWRLEQYRMLFSAIMYLIGGLLIGKLSKNGFVYNCLSFSIGGPLLVAIYLFMGGLKESNNGVMSALFLPMFIQLFSFSATFVGATLGTKWNNNTTKNDENDDNLN